MVRQSYTFPEDSYLLLGKVTKAQGLRGEVSIHAFSGEAEGLGRYDRFTLVDGKGVLSPELLVTGFRVHGNRAIFRFDKVVDRSFAEKLVGMGVLLKRELLPEPDQNEFYWHEMFGRSVTTADGTQLGVLKDLFSNGAQEIMVIGDANSEYLVPATSGMIVEYSDSSIVIDPPSGLLTINSDGEDD